MAKSPVDPRVGAAATKAAAKAVAKDAAPPPATLVAPTGYFTWSRDPAVSLFAVAPLWIAYELLRLLLSPGERNGAEVLMLAALARLGPVGVLVPRLGLALLVLLALRSVLRRQIPWARVLVVLALEGMVYGLLLGPVASALARPASRLAAGWIDGSLLQNITASLGAGLYEELVFRLGLMSLLAWLCLRATRALSLPRWTAGAVAVVFSAIPFSWFHHLWGEPFERPVFVFRAVAGAILGLLFWFRGYGICVYTHAMYDIYLYWSQRHP